MAFKVGNSSSKKVVDDKMMVLIVDDDPLTRMFNKIFLRQFGFKNFTVAKNGKEAVELCQSGGKFDIIMMDRQMPIMDGIEATKLLREMGVVSKIIAVTADDEDIVKKRFEEAGVDQFFLKPLNKDKIDSLLKNM